MKNAAFAFAALLATSGSALAGEASKPKIDTDDCRATQSQSTRVDCQSTGSTVRDLSNTENVPAGMPKLGYDGDPWIVPNVH